MGRLRDLQILTGEDESPRSKPQSYPTYFRCKMDPVNKRKFNPWAIEKRFNQEIGSKPATMRSNNESEYGIETLNEKESKILPTIFSLYSSRFQERFQVEIFACDKINQSKGLMYIHDCNIPDIDEYDCELKKQHNFFDVQKAT